MCGADEPADPSTGASVGRNLRANHLHRRGEQGTWQRCGSSTDVRTASSCQQHPPHSGGARVRNRGDAQRDFVTRWKCAQRGTGWTASRRMKRASQRDGVRLWLPAGGVFMNQENSTFEKSTFEKSAFEKSTFEKSRLSEYTFDAESLIFFRTNHNCVPTFWKCPNSKWQAMWTM